MIFWLVFLTLYTTLLAQATATDLPSIQTIATTRESGDKVWETIQDSQGRIWTAIYLTQNRLVLLNDQKQEIPLTGQNATPSGLAMAAGDAGQVWAAYRNLSPQREIFVIRSDNPTKTYNVSGNTMPLSRIDLQADGTGGVYILWYGEMPTPGQPQPGYWVWFNHLSRDGQIGTPEKVLPGIYPLWLHDSVGRIAVFSWYKDANGRQIGMRLLNSTGSFGPTVAIAKLDYLSPPLGTFSAGNRWFVYWLAQYGALKDDFLIEGAYSDDLGSTWQHFNLEQLRKLGVNNLQATADGAGHIALAITGRYLHPEGNQPNKLAAYLVTSNDNGSTWHEPLLLRPADASYSQAPNAKVTFVDNGGSKLLLVGIEDWRTIRPSIRYWLSADNGTTWLLKDEMLPLAPAFNYQFGYTNQSLYHHTDKLCVILQRLGDDLVSRTIALYTTDIKQLLNPQPQHNPTPDLNRLQTRVNAYGQALINRDYQSAYNLFDPFYRASVDFLGHLQTQGRIAYKTAEFATAQIQGQIATVQFHIIASIPPFQGSNGEIMQSPVRDVTFPVRWLWVDDDWYMEYYSEARELRYTRY